MNQPGFRRLIRLPLLLLCMLLSLPASAAGQADIALTQQEQAYRERAGEIVIGCPVGSCPLLFQDERTGQLEGISIDILDMIAETAGLTFRYEALPSGSITYEDLERLHVDMVAGVENNAFNHQATGIALTDAYLHAAKVFVCKRGREFDPDGAMTVALSTGSQTLEKVIRKQYPHVQILLCSSTEDALSALLRGKADAVLQNQYTLERLLRKPIYENLSIVASSSIGDSQCLASMLPIDENGQSILPEDTAILLSILDKSIAALDQSQVAFSIIRQTSENAYQFTLADTLYHYRFAAAGLLISLVMILILLQKNHVLHTKRLEQLAAQQRARELAAINARMKEQQLLLMDALKRAEEGNRAKASFLFNMSHDIRTPMNAILGFAELSSRSLGDPERLAGYLAKIQSSGKHLLELMNNVLDMTQIENGDVTLSESLCSLAQCVARTRESLEPELEARQQTLETDASALQNEWVYCDGLRLQQILYHLVSNAVKFSSPGSNIQVILRQSPCAIEEYAAYEIRVRDHGIGMSPEFLSHIFEPFERERTSTISKTEGAGLGLPITKKLIDLMGGTIDVASQPDQGTEVTLQFTFKLHQEKRESCAGDASDFTGKRLLLVDDNELNMEIAAELLCETGFVVETAANGQIAVDMVRASSPGYYDAILMDIQMPVMDGYAASRAIRSLEDPALANIPIIALTANAFDEDKKKSLANGLNAHLAKPLDIGVLCETLGSILKGSHSA